MAGKSMSEVMTSQDGPSSSEATGSISASRPATSSMPKTLFANQLSSFQVVLIDGDTDVAPPFLQSGYQGGITFARNIERAVRDQDHPSNLLIIVYFTSTPDPLKQTLLHSFLDGVNEGTKLSIAGQTHASVIKLEGFLKLYVGDASCTRIFVGGLRQARFAGTLRLLSPEAVSSKVVLLVNKSTHAAFESVQISKSSLLLNLPEPVDSLCFQPNTALGLSGVPQSPFVDHNGEIARINSNNGSDQLVSPMSPLAPSFPIVPGQVSNQYVSWTPGAGWTPPMSEFSPLPPGDMYRHLSIDSQCSSLLEMAPRQPVPMNGAVPSPQPSSSMSNGPGAMIPVMSPAHNHQPGPPYPMSIQSPQQPPFMPPFGHAARMSPPQQPFASLPPLSINSAPFSPAMSSPSSAIVSPVPFPASPSSQIVPMSPGSPLDPHGMWLALASLKRKIDQTPKRSRPCNMYYRLNSCPHKTSCSLSHRFPFTAQDWAVYPLLVKQLVCRNMLNGTCKNTDETCVFGHRCRFSKDSCPFGSKCRFVIAQVSGAHGEPVDEQEDDQSQDNQEHEDVDKFSASFEAEPPTHDDTSFQTSASV